MRRFILIAAVLPIMGACGNPDSAEAGAYERARAVASELSGDGADNPLCSLFTPSELAAYAGEPLGAGENAAVGSGCMWLTKDGEGDVLIQVADKSFHANPYLADGYRTLPDVGTDGNVSPAMGGWIASAIVGDETVVASVTGKTGNAEQAEALLREVIRRRSR